MYIYLLMLCEDWSSFALTDLNIVRISVLKIRLYTFVPFLLKNDFLLKVFCKLYHTIVIYTDAYPTFAFLGHTIYLVTAYCKNGDLEKYTKKIFKVGYTLILHFTQSFLYY